MTGEFTLVAYTFDLSSDITAAHIHQAPAGENGDVAFALVIDDSDSSIVGLEEPVALTDEQMDVLLDEGYYVNVHTVDVPSGEIRGQID